MATWPISHRRLSCAVSKHHNARALGVLPKCQIPASASYTPVSQQGRPRASSLLCMTMITGGLDQAASEPSSCMRFASIDKGTQTLPCWQVSAKALLLPPTQLAQNHKHQSFEPQNPLPICFLQASRHALDSAPITDLQMELGVPQPTGPPSQAGNWR